MDRRRERVAGAPGTLWTGKNVHITRGGDIERRKKFVPDYYCPGTFGALSYRNHLYVFGSDAVLPQPLPPGVAYSQLISASGSDMVAILDAKVFQGSFYVIAEFSDGHVYHYYGGVRVSDWDVIGLANGSIAAVARLLTEKIEADEDVTVEVAGPVLTISAREAGTAFTITGSATNGGVGVNDQTLVVAVVQPNVAAVAETLATAEIEITGGTQQPGTNAISSVKVNTVELLTADIDWLASNADTATRLATAITTGYTTHGYSAEAVGAVVTISAAAGTGTAPNGYTVTAATIGDATLTADLAMAGGVAATEAVKQIARVTLGGTFEAADTYDVVINGTTYKATGLAAGTGRSLFISNSRIFSPTDSLWNYCMLGRGDVWDPDRVVTDNDAGFVNVASETEGSEAIVTAARYQDLAAIFSNGTITLMQLDADPSNFAFTEHLEHTGTLAVGAVVRYGNNDVFYLDLTGIRSLRARDASNAPFVSDVGNAIDTFVQEYVDSLPVRRLRQAKGVLEPRDGRFWLAAGDRIFVLSDFPGAKISAWTYYEPEEFEGEDIQSIVRAHNRLHIRAGDYIYTYGGLEGSTYPDEDEAIAEVDLPFLSAKTPATIKHLTGFDVALTNTWECEIAFDPNHPDKTQNVGRLQRITFADANRIPVPSQTAMMAPKLVCRKAGAATISMLAIHYEAEEAG